jgi:hypothetical protein
MHSYFDMKLGGEITRSGLMAGVIATCLFSGYFFQLTAVCFFSSLVEQDWMHLIMHAFIFHQCQTSSHHAMVIL